MTDQQRRWTKSTVYQDMWVDPDDGRLYGMNPEFGVFGVARCFMALRSAYRDVHDSLRGIDAIVHAAGRALLEGDAERACELSQRGLAKAVSPRGRAALWKTLAWGGVARDNPFSAHEALLHLDPASLDVHLLAAYLACCNRIDESVAVLEEARRFGQGSAACTKLLADLLFRRGDTEAVLELARARDCALSAEERHSIEVAVAERASV